MRSKLTTTLFSKPKPIPKPKPPLTAAVDSLGKSRSFADIWSLLLRHCHPIPASTFATLIRRYNRAGMPHAAIRTFQFATRNSNRRQLDAPNLDLEITHHPIHGADHLFDEKIKTFGGLDGKSQQLGIRNPDLEVTHHQLGIPNPSLDGADHPFDVKIATLSGLDGKHQKLSTQNQDLCVTRYQFASQNLHLDAEDSLLGVKNGALDDSGSRHQPLEIRTPALEDVNNTTFDISECQNHKERVDGMRCPDLGDSEDLDNADQVVNCNRLPSLCDLDHVNLLVDGKTRSHLGNPDELTDGSNRHFDFSVSDNADQFIDINHSDLVDEDELFDVLIDSMCKEGHTEVAEDYISQKKDNVSVRCYNILLNGWFRARKLRKAEKVWKEMRSKGVRPTCVTYGTLIEGLCRLGKVNWSIALIEEMRKEGIEPNVITCNPIVDALAEARRFKAALGVVEKFPLYGISPNVSTYNSLIKGFCKTGDPVGASNVLKVMTGRGILPIATTYNYFFRFFAKSGKLDEGLNLYDKMIQSGYDPDRLTYHLLIKMSCEEGKLDTTVKLIREMNKRGFESDLATCTMLVHMLCQMNKWEEACAEFENMIEKGIVPQYLTYRRLVKNLKRLGMIEKARKLSGLMRPLLRSTKLPATYKDGEEEKSLEVRMAIVKKAKVMSDVLKEAREQNKLSELKRSAEIIVGKANKLIAEIRRNKNSE